MLFVFSSYQFQLNQIDCLIVVAIGEKVGCYRELYCSKEKLVFLKKNSKVCLQFCQVCQVYNTINGSRQLIVG